MSVLTFLARYINDPAYAEILIEVTHTLLGKNPLFSGQWKKLLYLVQFSDIYESSCLTPQSEKLFLQLQEHVNREAGFVKHLMQIEGMLHILLASASTQTRRDPETTNQLNSSQRMIPSAAASASTDMVYNVSWTLNKQDSLSATRRKAQLLTHSMKLK